MAGRTPGGTRYADTAAAPRDSAELQWTQSIGFPAGQPSIADGLVIVPATDRVYAFDLETGSTRWEFDPGNSVWPTPAAIDVRTAFFGMQDSNRIVALGIKDGTERWRESLAGPVTVAPVLSPGDNQVYFGTESGRLVGLDRETGSRRWRLTIGHPVTALALRPPLLFAGTAVGTVVAVEWTRGDVVWDRSMTGRIRALAVGDGDQVFVGTASGTLARLSGGGARGRTVWSQPSGPVAHGGFVLTRDLVIGTDRRGITALDRDRGRRRWRVTGAYPVAPAGAADTVYVGGPSGIDAVRLGISPGVAGIRRSARRWRHPMAGKPVTGLAVAGGMILGVRQGNEGAEVFAIGSA